MVFPYFPMQLCYLRSKSASKQVFWTKSVKAYRLSSRTFMHGRFDVGQSAPKNGFVRALLTSPPTAATTSWLNLSRGITRASSAFCGVTEGTSVDKETSEADQTFAPPTFRTYETFAPPYLSERMRPSHLTT